MIRSFSFSIALLVLAIPAQAQNEVADPDFTVQGEYAGEGKGLQVIALGNGELELVLYAGGLPGQGWDRQEPRRFEGDADEVESIVKSQGLKRIERSSPTLGAKPPANAIVLFDGSEKSLQEHWEPGAKLSPEGWLQEGANTKDKFQDFTLHLEFRTPYQPKARGQGRGNSGVYYQGRYETQILDSFGLKGAANECGGIYEVRPPDWNACLPPMVWQTYDVDFTAARFDAQGKKLQDAKLTVRLNGATLHRDVAVPHATRAAIMNEGPEPGPLHLQNHGNAVRFRNIWVIPRDAEREIRRPIVSAVERFYGSGGANDWEQIAAGRVLINELECRNCHQGKADVISEHVSPKLQQIGQRVRFDYLLNWIEQPHQAKPGTVMPDLLGHLSPEQRKRTALALASYLMGEDQVVDERSSHVAVRRGETVFHSIGCIACHASQTGLPTPQSTSVPLPNLAEKYTLGSLAQFLRNPHVNRPSGRMPSFGLTEAETRDLAAFLLRDVVLHPGSATMHVKIYHGSWNELPDFASLKPVDELDVSEISVAVTDRRDNFGLQFETFIETKTEGKFKFHLGSDDGSRLRVDDMEVLKLDGIHAYDLKTKAVSLKPGLHRVQVDYFEYTGEEVLTAEVEGPGLPRASLGVVGRLKSDGAPPEPLIASRMIPQPELVSVGKSAFRELRCIACHEPPEANGKEGTQSLAGSKTELNKLNPSKGCLANEVPAGLPRYELTATQVAQIASALDALRQADFDQVSPKDQLHLTMLTMNCYACHARDGLGGPETGRNERFQTKIPEMGEEGRLPPPLDGAGDKLNETFLRKVVEQGADQRPYMLTKMPGFRERNLPGLIPALVKLDQIDGNASVHSDEVESRVFANGRQLVGDTGLACVKCHTFNGKGTAGIQAIDLLEMTGRLREDWFQRYLREPQKYRPGTRMPTSFTGGRSTLTTIHEGDPGLQIDAMWRYLKQGKAAREPSGLTANKIVLQPKDRPIIYRNFIVGLSPRGIAVGYPEGIHQAWDADRMALTLIWRGGFIDASKHWEGRGPGFQDPLGDEIVKIEEESPVALIESDSAPWPKEPVRARGYVFDGYKLDSQGRPAFRYHLADGTTVQEKLMPLPQSERPSFERTLLVASNPKPIALRLATGKQIEELSVGEYRIDQTWILKIVRGTKVRLRESEGKQEIVGSLPAGGGEVLVEIRW